MIVSGAGETGVVEQEAVLVIRGELLKKYPTAIIYAHKARWDTPDGHADPTKERVLEPLTGNLAAEGKRHLEGYEILRDLINEKFGGVMGKKLVFASNRNAAKLGDTNIFIADWVE